jgi:hypothetical protein
MWLLPSSKGQSTAPRSSSQLDVPDAYRQLETQQRNETLDPASPSYLNPSSFLVWGPVTVRPHLETRFTYGNNLRSASGSNEDTFLAEISPGSFFQLGQKWQLDYTPTLSYYASKEFKDTLGHNALLAGGTTYDNWGFTFSQSFSDTTQPLIETGAQTEEQNFVTNLGATYHFASKLMLELGINQHIRNTEGFSKSRTWSTMDWLNYQAFSRLSVGLGVGGGYENVSPGSDMTFEQAQAKINVRVAEKIDFVVTGGGEVRQILDVGGDPLVNPVYGASLTYHPFEFTTLTLSANRTISAALLQDQINEMTTVSLALSQRLLGHLYLTLSGGFANNKYVSADSALTVNRSDDTKSFAATLSYPFNAHANASIFYNYNDNSSDSAAFSYSTSQIGLQMGYRF